MRRVIPVIGSAIALAMLAAIPAHAATNPVSGQITGTVVIPATLTMTLSANSFNVDPNPGITLNTGTSPFVVTADISTNDSAGYTLSETEATTFSDGTGDTIPNGDIQPYQYPGGPSSNGGFMGNNMNATDTIASVSTPAADDKYGLAWQFTVPGSQAAGSYTGIITVTAIGN
jgi:hypothetical protein